jgi:hypothetical protein
MSTLAAVLEEATFADKVALLEALAKQRIVTVIDLQSYDCCALMAVPPPAASVAALLGSLGGGIVDDAKWRTALGQVLVGVKVSTAKPAATAEGTEAKADGEKEKADEFGLSRYKVLGAATLATVRATHRVEGKTVMKTFNNLDRGTLSPDCYNLAGQKNILVTETEKRATVGGVAVNVASADDNSLASPGEVLMLIWIFTKMMLAAGMRPVTPSACNPEAGSQGDRGRITVTDAAGGKKVERWHVTQDMTDQYLIAAIAASTMLTPAQLVLGHLRLQELVVDKLHDNFNYESALAKVLSENTFASACAQKAASNAAPAKRAPPQNQRAPQGQVKRASASQGEASTAPLTPKKKPKGNAPLCFDFQRGECTRGDKCIYEHKCSLCGDKGHGAHLCPRVSKP